MCAKSRPASDLPTYSVSPVDPAFYNNPYPAYDAMRALGPAFVWQQYKLTCFARYDQVNAILRDRRFGREATHVMSREEAGLPEIPEHLKRFYAFEANSMLEREPPVHTRLRGLVNRAFVARRIEALAPAIETLADALVDGFPRDAPFDLLAAFCEPIPVLIISDLLGISRSMAEQLLAWSHAMVAMYQFNRDRETEDQALAAMEAFSNFIREEAAARRTKPKNDLLSALVEARDSGDRLSDDELVTTVILLLNAGHEATVHGLGNGIKAILEAQMDARPHFATKASGIAAADELLRHDAPLHMFTRFVLEDLEIAGIQLKRGQSVGLLLGAANRDPQRYAAPDRLDFSRGGQNHVAFGAGIHFCLGAPLARLEMAVSLGTLFHRCPNIALAEKPAYADRYHFHGLEELMVTIT